MENKVGNLDSQLTDFHTDEFVQVDMYLLQEE